MPVDSGWTSQALDGLCNVQWPVYCFQIPEKKLIFVSDTQRTGNLGGLAGADAICQAEAERYDLDGTYKAWLSSSTVAAKDRVTQWPYGYRNADDDVIAISWEDLVDGQLSTELNAFADGTPVPSGTAATWTATSESGGYATPSCSDWTSTSGQGTVGLNTLTSAIWTNWGTRACSELTWMYCIEQ